MTSRFHLPSGVRACFVTGTDTEVGKTRVSAALLHWCAQQGWRSAGLKPVAAGTEMLDGERANDDVRTLRAAASVPLTDADICPFQFDAACAPHIAAALEGRTIATGPILQAAHRLAQQTDVLVVEGAGGFRVPLAPGFDSADLTQALGLPVVLVVGLRLGCINHALLTAEAVRARGLRLAGWVGNSVDPAMPWRGENVQTLRQQLLAEFQAPCLGVVPHLAPPTAAAVATHLDDTALHALFDPRP
ncbi:MAG TPA: dethiobiotin synthase [Macromonas sp.]|nr:dethiobiotin synthase [Macromonas sp.]